MNKIIIYLFITVIFCSCIGRLNNQKAGQLSNAYKEHNYFKLDMLMSEISFDKDNPELMLYRAKLENVFNNPTGSNILINELLDNYSKHFNDSIIADLYYMRSINAYA